MRQKSIVLLNHNKNQSQLHLLSDQVDNYQQTINVKRKKLSVYRRKALQSSLKMKVCRSKALNRRRL
jgi:hypothetical protein